MRVNTRVGVGKLYSHTRNKGTQIQEKKTFHVKYYATRIQLHTFGHILLTLTGRVNKRNCVVSESNLKKK